MTQATLNPFDYSPSRALSTRILRRLRQMSTAAPIRAMPDAPMISFSFDDFPVSAAQTGAESLAPFDIKATYYACSGLVGLTNQTGLIFSEVDLQPLISAGHEIAAHTHSHLDCGAIPVPDALADIDENLTWLIDHDVTVSSFAYPYGETTRSLKRNLPKQFKTARGITPGINRIGSDLNQLRAVELSPDSWTHNRAQHAIETVARTGGWLILFTHDVGTSPSPFGVQPAALRELARKARDSGAELLTVSEAASRIEALAP